MFPIEVFISHGQGLRATRNLIQGEKILCCAPLVAVPRVNPSCPRQLISCSGCILATKSLILCQKCRVASHCSTCLMDLRTQKIHQEECSILTFLSAQNEDLESHLEVRCLIRLLGILGLSTRQQLSEMNATLLAGCDDDVIVDALDSLDHMMSGQYESNDGHLSEKQLFQIINAAKKAKFLVSPVNRKCMDFYVRLLGIMQLNSFECVDEVNNTTSLGQGCFPTASFFNHSCQPNVVGVFDCTGCLHFTTLKDVPKHGQLFLNYATESSREDRRKILLERYGFDCQCQLCANGL
jgi:SET and MYND domain-containing protein